MKTLALVTSLGIAGFAPLAVGQVIFSDDFESGDMSRWTATATTPSPLVIQTGTNASPGGGNFSAYLNISTDRMHHNIIADNGGAELDGYALFTSYWYDNSGTATRYYNEVRGYSGGTGLPNGGTTATGTLAQLLAIGKYNTVTLAGDVYDATKYQARIAFGSTNAAGWFNLNAPGVPDRSTGWHKFTIERLADGSTINFYVDDVLGRTLSGATIASWDTVILGPGLGTTAGDAWSDGITVMIPEPTSLSLCLLGGFGMAAWLRRRAVA
jgi:hypothetical protein